MFAAFSDVLAYAMLPELGCTCVGCYRVALVTALGYVVFQEHAGQRQTSGFIVCAIETAICLCFGPRSNSPKDAPSTRRGLSDAVVGLYLACGATVPRTLFGVDHVTTRSLREALLRDQDSGSVE